MQTEASQGKRQSNAAGQDEREKPAEARAYGDHEEENSEKEDDEQEESDQEEKSEEEEEQEDEQEDNEPQEKEQEEEEKEEEQEEEEEGDDEEEETKDVRVVLANYSEKLQKTLMGDLDSDFPENVKVVRIFTSSTFTGKYFSLRR